MIEKKGKLEIIMDFTYEIKDNYDFYQLIKMRMWILNQKNKILKLKDKKKKRWEEEKEVEKVKEQK